MPIRSYQPSWERRHHHLPLEVLEKHCGLSWIRSPPLGIQGDLYKGYIWLCHRPFLPRLSAKGMKYFTELPMHLAVSTILARVFSAIHSSPLRDLPASPLTMLFSLLQPQYLCKVWLCFIGLTPPSDLSITLTSLTSLFRYKSLCIIFHSTMNLSSVHRG